MGLKIILTGATGMVGEGILQECIRNPNVDKIIVLNRKSSGYSHPKVEEITVNILNDIFKKNVLQKNTYDAVVMNPPYKEVGKGKTNENSSKLIARHEVKATLSDFIKVAAGLLKDKGELYIVHKPERIVDIMQEMRANKIEPKKMSHILKI